MWGMIIKAKSVIAHFRRGFSTTSALTYPFPPRTAVIGLLGAIVGANKKTENGKNMLKNIDDSVSVGVRWIKGHMVTFGINNMYGKNEQNKRINEVFAGAKIWADNDGKGMIVHLPTPMEYILYPEYEIALVSENKEFLKELQRRIEKKEFVFAPYLGVQGALASVEVVMPVQQIHPADESTETSYVVPESAANVLPGEKIFLAIVPRKREYFDEYRKVTDFERVYWGSKGSALKIQARSNVWDFNGQAIPTY